MNDSRRVPSVPKWPFLIADVLLLGIAFWIFQHYPHPLPSWAAGVLVGCVAGAALLGILPFRMEHQTAVRFAEAGELADTARELEKLQGLAEQIRHATAQWQTVQEHSDRSVVSAKAISEQMASEAKAFSEFMRKANDSEKATLRLEIEKLRRGEGQWLQVIVHLLDHVYALQQAGARSGQPNLEAQLSRFQEACRDVVRRVGLTPHEAAPTEPFDPAKHQVPDGQPSPEAGALVGQTLATGYSFQGQLVRKPVVLLQPAQSTPSAESVESEVATLLQETPEVSQPVSDAPADDQSASREQNEMSPEQEFRLEPEELTGGEGNLRRAQA